MSLGMEDWVREGFWEARRRVSIEAACWEERIVAAWSFRWDLRADTGFVRW